MQYERDKCELPVSLLKFIFQTMQVEIGSKWGILDTVSSKIIGTAKYKQLIGED